MSTFPLGRPVVEVNWRTKAGDSLEIVFDDGTVVRVEPASFGDEKRLNVTVVPPRS